MNILKHVKAFFLGIQESLYDTTTHFDDWDLLETYDKGRNVGRFFLRLD